MILKIVQNNRPPKTAATTPFDIIAHLKNCSVWDMELDGNFEICVRNSSEEVYAPMPYTTSNAMLSCDSTIIT